MQSTSICKNCNITFQPSLGAKGHYCSVSCTNTGRQIKYKLLGIQANEEKERQYYQNPTHCHHCKESLPYNKRKNKFCNSSCSASHNNRGSKRTAESKKLISEKIRYLHSQNLIPVMIKQGEDHPGWKGGQYKKSIQRYCIACGQPTVGIRKTCSSTCLKTYQSQKASENLRNNRHKYVGPHKRSWMERTFVEWLEKHNITKGIYGYWDEVHFKHTVNNKKKNGWADFVFVSRKLIIELDGTHHRTRADLDAVRDSHLSSMRGYTVVRISHA